MTKDFSKQMQDYNNLHCGFMSDDFNDVTIYNYHNKTADYGVYNPSTETLILVNQKDNEAVFKSKLADSIWLPIIRSMSEGATTVTVNELHKLIKSRHDFKKVSEIPDDVLKTYGQHEAEIVIISNDQHVAECTIIDIEEVDDKNSIVLTEMVITGSSVELDLDNNHVEKFELPAYKGVVRLSVPVPGDLIPQDLVIQDRQIKLGEFAFVLNLFNLSMLKRTGETTLK